MSDLIFICGEPKGRVYVSSNKNLDGIYRRTGPHKFYKNDRGAWIWEGHCGKFKDGTVRPPWHDCEWLERFEAGDPSYGDASTYGPDHPQSDNHGKRLHPNQIAIWGNTRG